MSMRIIWSKLIKTYAVLFIGETCIIFYDVENRSRAYMCLE